MTKIWWRALSCRSNLAVDHGSRTLRPGANTGTESMLRRARTSPVAAWIFDKIAIVVSVAIFLLIVSLLANGILEFLDWVDPDTVTSGEDVVRDLVREHEHGESLAVPDDEGSQ